MLKDMRSMLELFRSQGDLRSVTEAVSLVHGVAAGIRATSRVNGPALSFENVEGATMPVVGGLYASRRRLLAALGTDLDTYFARFANALAHPIEPVVSAGPAPCQEVVLEGEAANLEWLPVCTYNEQDAGPFITMGIVEDPPNTRRGTGGRRQLARRIIRATRRSGAHRPTPTVHRLQEDTTCMVSVLRCASAPSPASSLF